MMRDDVDDELAAQLSAVVNLNHLCYCASHGREVCHDCRTEYGLLNEFSTFKLPENGIPQYPAVLNSIRDEQLRKLLGKRWLDMQKALYEEPPEPIRVAQMKLPKPPPGPTDLDRYMIKEGVQWEMPDRASYVEQPVALTSDHIKLPEVEVPAEVKDSPTTLQGTLLQLFRQLQGMASTQRYYFANQSKILLQDYEIFNKAAVLYQEQLSDQNSRNVDHYTRQGLNPFNRAQQRLVDVRKAKASIVNTFGFFLELNTLRTFWRAMELTVDAFVLHIESFKGEADGQVVMTDKAKSSFLQWLAHFFWSLQHAQFRLNELRTIQVEVYQRGVFPFFPYTLKALKEDSDIHLVIAKLCRAPVFDLPLVSSLFGKLGQASAIPEQMQHINADFMAAIDEMSTRFRMLETFVLVAHLVATQDEIKSALATFNFHPKGKEIHSRVDDVNFILTNIETTSRDDVPKKQTLLQKLIVKENLFRQKNVERVVRPPFVIDSSDRLPKEMFDAFKSNFTVMYRDSIRRQWKEEEHSLLGLDVARRFQHRLEIEKKKKKKRPLSSEGFEKADMGEVRSVPERIHVDPSLFWDVGDGTLEKYVLPVVRKKIKTRKQGTANDQDEDTMMAGNGAVSSPVATARSSDASEVEKDTPPLVQRPLDQLKHTDLVTRDILWRKIKGSLKWSQLVQFLSRIGCKILNLDGSKKKIEDTLSGRCMVLHRPHPGDECRPDQRESYRNHIEDWLKIEYSHLVRPDGVSDTEMLDSDSTNGTTSGA